MQVVYNRTFKYRRYVQQTNKQTNKQTRFIPLEDFKKAIHYLLANNLADNETVFHLYNWGEPLLHPDFDGIINILNDNNLKFYLSTNASVFHGFGENLSFRNLNSIIFSISGFRQASYDRIHGFKLADIKQNIVRILTNLRKNGFTGDAVISYHVYQFNPNELADAILFASQNNISISPYYAYFNGLNMFKSYLKAEMKYDMLLEASKDLVLYYFDDFAKKRPSNYKCPQIKNVLAIDEFCNVLTCCCLEKGSLNYSVGNLFSLSLDSIRYLKENQSVCAECEQLHLDFLMNNAYRYGLTQPESTKVVKARGENGDYLPGLATIDSPTQDENLLASLYCIHGWCLDGRGVESVDVLIDGVFTGKSQYGYPRPDVLGAYPSYKNMYSGYEYSLDVSGLSGGQHTIQIVGRNFSGGYIESNTVTFHVTKDCALTSYNRLNRSNFSL